MRRRNPEGSNLGLILLGLVVSGAIIVGLVLWGRSRAAAAAALAPSSPVPKLPDLAVNDVVEIDPVAANAPEPARSLPTIVATVVALPADTSRITVQSAAFAGTILRSAIRQVLPRLNPADKT